MKYYAIEYSEVSSDRAEGSRPGPRNRQGTSKVKNQKAGRAKAGNRIER